jgi:hypothetical protein
MEYLQTFGLMALVLVIGAFLKGPFWVIYRKIWPPEPKLLIDPEDPFDLKARELKLKDKTWRNQVARQEWQQEFRKLEKELCKHVWSTHHQAIPMCKKCRKFMPMHHTYRCTCDWDTYDSSTFARGGYIRDYGRLNLRDKNCPDHGDKVINK